MKKNELHKIAPKLSSLKSKKIGFTVPKNYFESIEVSVLNTISIENLQSKTLKPSFKTPENYFDTFEDIVISKLKAEVLQTKNEEKIPEDYFNTIEDAIFNKIKNPSKSVVFKNKVIQLIAPVSVAVAASLLLIFTLNQKSVNITFDSLATSEIETLIENGTIEIDNITLETAFSDVEITYNDYSNTLSDEEVEDYLKGKDLEEIIYDN
ncbi:hypothetical protein [Lutibacter sp. B1]|uniref:hypothetical protein n=1 Tax=Lutibacter sp. B1 TaxID=2725996 RepID=UPI0014569F79|nr:hypothetical protein [Lutibacter sp. B1]NLP56935.1 hypothetical protein [Lutibacter sp. B1]